jgi:hypothetical protein
MKQLIAYAALAFVSFFASESLYAAGLNGATVTVGVYTTNPGTLTLASNTPGATVGPTVEFPLGSLTALLSFNVIPITIDLTANTIDLHYPSGANATATSFNGYIFDFANLALPGITAVSVDPLSSLSPVGFSFTANQVRVNVAGLNIPANSDIILDIASASAAPEPAEAVLLLAGLGLMGFVVHRRNRKSLNQSRQQPHRARFGPGKAAQRVLA